MPSTSGPAPARRARTPAGLCARLAIATVALALAPPAAGAASARHAPRRPDLEGVWETLSLTPLQRSPKFKSLVITEADARAFDAHFNDHAALEAEMRQTAPADANDVGDPDLQWLGDRRFELMRIDGQARSSVLIDPADGKLPYRPDIRASLRTRFASQRRPTRDVEQRPLDERCLIISGPPMIGGGGLFRIVQTASAIVIHDERALTPRIVHMGARPSDRSAIRPWQGNSAGWWEGGTLVVETTGFNANTAYWAGGGATPLSGDARVTERFSRRSSGELLYRFTVEDPANYSQPWSGVMVAHATPEPMLPFECHEGNYALRNILAGARREDSPTPADPGLPAPASPPGVAPWAHGKPAPR